MEGDNSKEKISLQDMTTYDDQLFSSGDETGQTGDNSKSRCKCSLLSKRTVISILALLGFANVYALRVNLSVALVAMVMKNKVESAEGEMVEV